MSCLACLTPAAVIALGAIRLGAWTGHLDAVLFPCSRGSWGGRVLLLDAAEADTMKPETISAGVVASVGAALSSLCCLLPLAAITLGLGSGAFMAVTMRYRWFLIPAGIAGVVAGVALYVRERRRCDAMACRMAGSRITLAALALAALIVTTSIVLDRFPEMTSDLLARITDGGGHGAGGHDMRDRPVPEFYEMATAGRTSGRSRMRRQSLAGRKRAPPPPASTRPAVVATVLARSEPPAVPRDDAGGSEHGAERP